MSCTELMRRSAADLAALVRAGEVTSRELVEASLRRIAAVDGQVNAFTHVAADSALAAADAIGPGDARPFAGVPIAIKDNRAVAGMPLSMGSGLFDGVVPAHDAFCVARLRRAGFVIVGKTSLPEMGILPTCEPRRFGPTANPWDLARTPGGSSGGSAAAVAAGMVPVAHGNDGGGSLRIPAACCGLVGLKPARGRVSSGPETGHSFLSCDGVLTRTVADTALLLDVLSGYEAGDATWAPPPAEPFAALAGRSAARPLRIGLTVAPPVPGADVTPEAIALVETAARALTELGHAVDEIQPPWPGPELQPDFMRAFGPLISMQTLAGGRLAGREPSPDDVEPLTWALFEHARAQDTLSYLGAQGRLEATARTLVGFMAGIDVMLTPALASAPIETGTIHGRGPDPWAHFEASGRFTPFTPLINVTGQPAIAVPVGVDPSGLPLAVQLVGRPAREEVLLGLALALEQALPWEARVAPLARDDSA